MTLQRGMSKQPIIIAKQHMTTNMGGIRKQRSTLYPPMNTAVKRISAAQPLKNIHINNFSDEPVMFAGSSFRLRCPWRGQQVEGLARQIANALAFCC
jgi:hypothetical protein